MSKRIVFSALTVTLILLAGVVMAIGDRSSMWNDPVSQWEGITFSHKFHLEDVEAECNDCHPKAQASLSADDFLLPTHEECGDCHDMEEESECATCHGERTDFEGFAAPERLVFFNHRLHIEDQGLECTHCHAGMLESERPSTANLPGMPTCVACHNGSTASEACELCHVVPEGLMPASHREVDWIQEHKQEVRVGGGNNDCAVCHSDNFCQACHANPTLQSTAGASPAGRVPEYRPTPLGKWSLVLVNVHELNFLSTHSFDTRSKKRDCYVCHDQQEFCAECHSRNQEAGFGNPIPVAHGGPDFVRVGVGSGGGRHADLARREIESCASCHDVEGRDAVCLTCHDDRTPGRGNDPKTHSSSFFDNDVDLHSNPGSVCFNCHTDTGQAGVGFCAYCHGAKN